MILILSIVFNETSRLPNAWFNVIKIVDVLRILVNLPIMLNI